MDLLYYIPPRKALDAFGLRMSLRSISRYGKNLGKIVVTGSPTDWLCGNVEKFHTTPIFAKSGVNENILNAIQKVIQEGVLQSEFLLVSDDIFLIKEVDLNEFPFYVQRPRLQSINDLVRYSGGAVVTKNKVRLANTREILERNGYNAVDYSGHTLIHIDPADSTEVERMWLQEPHGEWGYDVASLFLNVRGKRENLMLTEQEDFQAQNFTDVATLVKQIGGRTLFSASWQLIENRQSFREMLSKLYPEKCQFEE